MKRYETKEEIKWKFIYAGVPYDVLIKKKKGMRNYRARFVSYDKGIILSCPLRASDNDIKRVLTKMMPSLLKKVENKRGDLLGDDEFYLFGQKMRMEGYSLMSQEKRNAFLKKKLLPVLEERVRLYEKMMGIKKPYRISVKHMSSRYGSNSLKTHTVAFSSILAHYSIELIDSVVIHELVHDEYRNHGKGFYKKLEKYDPLYAEHRKKLIKGIYE